MVWLFRKHYTSIPLPENICQFLLTIKFKISYLYAQKKNSPAVFELFFRIYHLNFLQKADVLDLVGHGEHIHRPGAFCAIAFFQEIFHISGLGLGTT